MKRIGIFGGTFDPPHLGHFMMADEVRYKMNLDEIWFIPTNKPPHKEEAATDNHHRYEMLVHATAQTNYFSVHAIELDRGGKSYTIDTVNELTRAHPDYSFYFIIGADMVEYLPHWRQIDELLKKVQFIGVGRSGFTLKTDFPVKKVSVPVMDISSTDIKKRVQSGAPFRYLIPQEIYTYIKEYRLYGYQ